LPQDPGSSSPPKEVPDSCTNPAPFTSSISRWFFAILILATMLVAFRLVEPFLIHIFLAMVLVVASGPFYNYLRLKMGWRAGLASGLTCILLTVIIALPMFLVASTLTSQALSLYRDVSNLLYSGQLQSTFKQSLGELAPYMDILHDSLGLNQSDILRQGAELVRQISNILYENITGVLARVTTLLVGLILVLFVTFFLLIDGPKMVDKFIALSPLPLSMSRGIQAEMLASLRATLRGTVVLAIINGTLAGLGFWIFGVPNSVFWGTVMTFSSVVPLIGTGLVWLPAGIYLIALGDWPDAVGVMVWCGAWMAVCDNIIRPKLIGSSTNLHPLLVFFSLLGGLSMFGMAGLLMGPMTLALLLSLLQVYQRYFLEPARNAVKDMIPDNPNQMEPKESEE
jgi:predicted PurR-regulated permease PerM